MAKDEERRRKCIEKKKADSARGKFA